VLCEIAAGDSVHVLVYPSLADLRYLRQGVAVDCLFDLGEPVVIRGHLVQILPLSTELQAESRAIVRAVPVTPHQSLHIGLKGDAKIKGDSYAIGHILFRRPWYWFKKTYWRYFGGLL
jgi:hypothetical protein